ncbi:hypothetical protein Lbir_1043 [Legionella birminghamensis]|uniref:Uncharacterized protein n=1 Tax=Legionella birminghamensis TaxID=28083 RepID=A0A378I7X5_9GAMM|nr:hypothetical protein Lbir_1043 [Legionella birminghamensis]STX30721.1 Uncharacterised protein [Legionella birminghamensis]
MDPAVKAAGIRQILAAGIRQGLRRRIRVRTYPEVSAGHTALLFAMLAKAFQLNS